MSHTSAAVGVHHHAGDLAADGPTGVALVRRLEGAMLALKAVDGTVIPTMEAEPT
jgi:hypothetical protein